MKSVIPLSIEELYVKHYGRNDWPKILKKAGMSARTRFYGHQDTPDENVIKLMQTIMQEKGLSMNELADLFGDYWVNAFAPRHYFAFFKSSGDAKGFLLKMNDVHAKIGSSVEGSKPPRFEYEELGDNKLLMRYISNRNLIDLVVGLVKGVGKKFDEEIQIKKLNEKELELTFLGKKEA